MDKIKKGYKKTKVGIIPKEWEVVRFKDIFKRVTRKNSDNNTNVLTISAQYGLINQEDFFNKSVASKDLSKYILLKKGEFAYNKSYSSGYPMGAFKRLKFYDKGVLSSLYIYFKIIGNNSPDFYEQYFEAGLMNREIYKIAQEGARNHGLLNMSVKEFFNDLLIAKPPLPEQQKIAKILTTWDRAIEKLKALIREKERLKKGLMQRLLSGKVRFKEFKEEWKEVRLGEVGKTYNGLSGKTAKNFGSGKPYIQYKQIFDNSKIDISKCGYVEILENEKQNKVQYGDIFFTTSSETPEEIAFSSVLLEKNVQEMYLNSFCFGFRINEFKILNPYFARYYFRSSEIRKKLVKLAQGSTRFNISKNNFTKIKIIIPESYEEQQKIAKLLTTADKEIELLKRELEALEEQKKGLMQKLLTGEIRVKGG